jgi:hypothetical protein
MMSFDADKPWLIVGVVLEQLDREHRDGMLAGMPSQMRTTWIEQMEPAFNAFISEVRRRTFLRGSDSATAKDGLNAGCLRDNFWPGSECSRVKP